ncbi:MAG: hypothetical protein LBK73_15370 [Treponema sp.]|nr:hypothetical protein [Treponema sp.]
MGNKLTTLIDLVKHLPEKYLDQSIKSLEKIKGDAENEEEGETPDCPRCRGKNSVRNGKRRGNKRCLCRDWGEEICTDNGDGGEAVWKQATRDTVAGIPPDRTVADPGWGVKPFLICGTRRFSAWNRKRSVMGWRFPASWRRTRPIFLRV